jgi:hypothetical protein
MSNIILLKFSSNCPECANGSKYYMTLEEIKMFNTKEGVYYYLYEHLQIEHVIDVDLELTKKYNDFIEKKFNYGFMTPNIDVESDCMECGYIYLYGDYNEIRSVDLSDGGYFANIRRKFPLVKSDELSDESSEKSYNLFSKKTHEVEGSSSNESFNMLSGNSSNMSSDVSSDESSNHDE